MPETPVTSPPQPRPKRAVTPRPRRSYWAQLAAGVRAWARETFAPDQLLNGLKSLMWVAPLTILIWIYAEREQISRNVSVQFRIEVKNSDPRFLVLLRDADGLPHADLQVQALLSGPHARVDEVVQSLKAIGGAVPVEVDTQHLGPGIHPVSLSALENNSLFVKAGVTVTTPVPREVNVSIDPIVSKDVEVRARPTVTNLEKPPVFEPRKVRVTGPESLLQGATLVAYAELPPLQEPGMRDIPNVEVALPFNDAHVTISPAMVSAKVEVKNAEVAGEVNAMPVWAVYPPGPFWDKYKPEFEPFISNVKVIGPADMVKQINDAAFTPKPKAILDVSTADPPVKADPTGVRYTGRLKIEFNDTGLKLSPEDTHKTITFTIVERKLGE
jgi:hypothetical protein